MRKILLLFSVIFIHSYTRAQFTENFSDGDFTANPPWTGDAGSYKINAAFQLQLNATGEGMACLSAPSTLQEDMEWNFWIKLSLAPSDNNMARVYLSSDQSDLKGALNGYYIKLGETGSADALELVRQSGNTHTVVCRGTDGFLASAFVIRVRVLRAAGGIWKVLADPLAGINYQLQASGTDNAFTTGAYLGVYSKFTGSNSTKFYYDDFYAGPVMVDNSPPALLSVTLAAANSLALTFSEPVETGSAADLGNYMLSPGSILPLTAFRDPADPSVVQLTFAASFTPDVSYTLAAEKVKDLAGNVMLSVSFPFMRHQAKAFDVLINEIMADPTPLVNLPDAEYLELYNRSAYTVDLKDWVLLLGSSEKIFPEFNLPAGGYVILCDDGNRPLLAPFGAVMDFSSFAVSNTGGTVTLKDNDGKVIHSVSYTDDWYRSSFKKEGGWSLELIDPTNPCGEAANWMACSNDAGGTPGTVNSDNALNPDLVAPAISRVGVEDALHITLWFTESCDSTFISDATEYIIDNGIGKPASVAAQSPAYRSALLTLPSPLESGILYTLTANGNISDCAGNPLLSGTSARFAIPSAPAANDIVINELLFDPVNGCVDFVEIYNRSSKVIDLRDIILSNYDTLTQAVTSYHEISSQPFLSLPGSYFVLSTDSASVKRYYKTTDPLAFINMEGFPLMNNDQGVVALTSKGGSVIDLAAYTLAMQYPLLTSMDGVSLERISPDRPSGDITNWHSAAEAVGYATPGYKNSQFGATITDENEISLSPDIFSPDNDGYNDNLTIAYTFGAPGNNASITIYDATGRLVRNLVKQQLCGTSGAFTWDGVSNDRLRAPIGRYIVYVEIFDLQGRVKHYKKSAVLGGKL